MTRTRHKSTSPYWLKAVFSGICSRCEGKIKKGEDILYYPATRTFLCNSDACGQQAQRDMNAEKQDLDTMHYGHNEFN